MLQIALTVVLGIVFGGGLAVFASHDVTCPPNCFAGHCDSNGNCKSCKDSFWGPTCDQTCPANCQYSRCSKTDGTCSGCKGNVFWGSECENPCPPHCFPGGQCKFKDGTCGSCSTPYWEHMPTCDLPGGCLSPKGTDCNYYVKCLDSIQKCPEVSSIMIPKCNEYLKLEPKLSKKGAAWSKTTRQCIQKKISDKVLSVQGANFSCDDVSATFFDEHVDCYLNGGPVSFCSLFAMDKLIIVVHGAGILTKLNRIGTVLDTGGRLFDSCTNHHVYADVSSSSSDLWNRLEAEMQKLFALRSWEYASLASVLTSSDHHQHAHQHQLRRVSEVGWVDMQVGVFGTVTSTVVTAEAVLEVMKEAARATEIPAGSVLLYNGESLI